MSDKVALITGITGQDGAYLAEYLLKMASNVVLHLLIPIVSIICMKILIKKAEGLFYIMET